jgi:hypothetical protein
VSSWRAETLTAIPMGVTGLAPRGALAAGLVAAPTSDLHDQAGLLEQRDEVVGLHDPARLAAPADQRLDAGGQSCRCRSNVGW